MAQVKQQTVKGLSNHGIVTLAVSLQGGAGSTVLLPRFHSPVDAAKSEKRWLDGLYLDAPEEMDDPYRFFRW